MSADFCIIGGGIAGLSIAAELTGKAEVIVLEREADLAYHTTGRSAALYSELVASSMALALSRLSRSFLTNPPAGFTPSPLHHDIGCIFTATAQQMELAREVINEQAGLQVLDSDQLQALVPVLRTGDGSVTCGLYEKGAFKIDVAALVDAYRRQFVSAGGTIRCNAEVVALQQQAGGWEIKLSNNDIVQSKKVINAAGAWGDVIAELANVAPLGLRPLRRTIIAFEGPENTNVGDWPAVGGIDGGYYFLPEAGLLTGSSADEVESPPCDAQPEEYDIALAAYNIQANTSLDIKRIQHKWAGLRTFSPDRQLVAGYDPVCRDFFWFVGQGGFGIQTAPAAAHAAAFLALEKKIPEPYEQAGVTEQALAPGRFVPTAENAGE